MAKLADARDSKSRGSNTVPVQVRPPAPDEEYHMEDCIFCKVVEQELPSEIIAENDKVLVIKDISPKASIHYLIITKEHYNDLQSAQECGVACSLMKMARYLGKEHPHYRLVINNGYEAGQRVFHLHMHFLAGKQVSEF